jgi:hypothetical protein
MPLSELNVRKTAKKKIEIILVLTTAVQQKSVYTSRTPKGWVMFFIKDHILSLSNVISSSKVPELPKGSTLCCPINNFPSNIELSQFPDISSQGFCAVYLVCFFKIFLVPEWDDIIYLNSSPLLAITPFTKWLQFLLLENLILELNHTTCFHQWDVSKHDMSKTTKCCCVSMLSCTSTISMIRTCL